MSKHKSELLTVKIQLKVNFPQAFITKIRTLPRVFPKMFRTAVWRKTWDSYFWHYVWKIINLCSRKVALIQYSLKCALHISSSWLNVTVVKKIKWELTENRQKDIFSIKKYLLIQSMISSSSKSSKRAWWSALF